MGEFLILMAVYIAAFSLMGLAAYVAAVCALLVQAATKAAVQAARPGIQKGVGALRERFGSWTRGCSGPAGDRGAKQQAQRWSGLSYSVGDDRATADRELDRLLPGVVVALARLEVEMGEEDEEDVLFALQERLEGGPRNRPVYGRSGPPDHGSRCWKEHRSFQHR
ncbi:MAG: hypothetical protein ABFD65_03095 [Candidatus Polarisedimenticolia bacterium]